MKPLVSPKQVARAVGVSESSLKRWCDQGLLPMVKTAGGHRRLPISGVLEFLRATGHEILRPEELGLPTSMGRGQRSLQQAAKELESALLAGDESVAQRILLDLYVAGQPLTALFDDVIAEAFHRIGDGWSCGSVEVYRERRAVEICQRALVELRSAFPLPAPSAPLAIGGTLSGDNYVLPTRMAELILRALGWQATSLGCNLPTPTWLSAIEQLRPRLVWISVSHCDSTTTLLEALGQVLPAARAHGAEVLLGGQALPGEEWPAEYRSVTCSGMLSFQQGVQRIWTKEMAAAS